MGVYDAIVVGMGPGGAMAAYRLASEGLSILGIDKERFPRYKSCGGCISSKVLRVIDFDIEDVIEDEVYGATFTYKSNRTVDILCDKPVGFNVMRDKFDKLLLDKARAAGAEVIEGERVKEVMEEGGAVSVLTDSGKRFMARCLVGADGAGGIVGREILKLNPKECAVSITAEVPIRRDSENGLDGRLYIDFGSVPYGYSWVFPKKDFLSVGLATEAKRLKKGIKEYLADLFNTHEALRGFYAEETTGWTIPIYYSEAQKVVKGRCLAVGDAGHLVDPFLGEGIYFAMKTGEMAAEVIASQAAKGHVDLTPYQEMVEREFFSEFEAASKLSKLVYSHPRMWYATMEGSPHIMERYLMVIRGEETYTTFYRWLVSKLKSRPWKLAQGWFKSRLLPA